MWIKAGLQILQHFTAFHSLAADLKVGYFFGEFGRAIRSELVARLGPSSHGCLSRVSE